MTKVRIEAIAVKPRQISKSQFKAQALALFREIETSGEAVVITDHGRPALEVRPYRQAETGSVSPLQALRGSVSHYEAPFDPVDDNDWEALA